MPSLFGKLLSYLHEQVVERVHSPVSGWVEVWLAYGRYELNTSEVNYSFGELHRVFQDTFAQLKVGESAPQRVLLLGLGAGSVVQLLREIGVQAPITAVELDPVVVTLGKKYFGLGSWQDLEVLEGVDAVDWLPKQKERYDLVIIDLFVGAKVPANASDPVFFEAVKESLNSGGLMLWNRLAHEEALESETMRFTQQAETAFPGLVSKPIRGNRILVWKKPQ